MLFAQKKKKKKEDFAGHFNFIIYKGGLRAIKLHVASPHKKEKEKEKKSKHGYSN